MAMSSIMDLRGAPGDDVVGDLRGAPVDDVVGDLRGAPGDDVEGGGGDAEYVKGPHDVHDGDVVHACAALGRLHAAPVRADDIARVANLVVVVVENVLAQEREPVRHVAERVVVLVDVLVFNNGVEFDSRFSATTALAKKS
eukprot:1183607-Prorocentrum_minimum.AAC.2